LSNFVSFNGRSVTGSQTPNVIDIGKAVAEIS